MSLSSIALRVALLAALCLSVEAAVNRSSGICSQTKPCSPGVLLPVWQPQRNLQTCTVVFRAFVYFLMLAYLFFGVSIVSDRFMAAIEVITSQEREVKLRKVTGEPYTILIRVWNETVSNLTLMALGSSAPEILLSVIEIIGNNFEGGDLGPSTIVGSAAFNLYVIIAVCIYVIPVGEVRRVKNSGVFWVTVVWSTFAYIWLYVILAVSSPGVVHVWEAVLTFIFFPLTVISAYVANRWTGRFGQRLLTKPMRSFTRRTDTGIHREKTHAMENGGDEHRASLLSGTKDAEVIAFEEHRQKYLEIFRHLRAEHPDASVVELEKLATAKVIQEAPKSRAFYRIQATRKMLGAGDITSKRIREKSQELVQPAVQYKPRQVVVDFDPCHYMCLENVGALKVQVRCDRGSIEEPCIVTVHYRTVAETAQEHSDFVPVEGYLTFEPDQDLQEIEIGIVDNDIYEEDEQFLVRLSQVKAVTADDEQKALPARLGAAATATVIIVDDDHAGAFSFSSEKFKVSENAGIFVVEVFRARGARGEVHVPFRTIDGMAKNGMDYIGRDDVLKFTNEQTKGEIRIEIVNDDEYEKSEDFYIELGEPIWVNRPKEADELGKPLLGDHSRCKVVITEDREFKNFVDKMLANANTSLMVGSSSWKQQFVEAFEVEDIDGDGSLSVREKVLHYVSLPWKILFALIPPTDYFNGWLCFCVAIFGIGFLTALIGDVASHFGCTIGLKDSVTAITLVALGTSLPDTFASKTAAIQDPTADSSIGNVTGSNAVNVFLGIGIAWSIAAIYHASNGTVFRIEAGSLAFSVTMFLLGSVVCTIILQIRRNSREVQGELGGPQKQKNISVVIFLSVWLVYVIVSTLVSYCIIPSF
uniref:Sodium/calcium exchanger 3 n=1 Tax=Steinernema glaseri TaxID=37863 RepID=A0A1I8A5K8_9BILA